MDVHSKYNIDDEVYVIKHQPVFIEGQFVPKPEVTKTSIKSINIFIQKETIGISYDTPVGDYVEPVVFNTHEDCEQYILKNDELL